MTEPPRNAKRFINFLLHPIYGLRISSTLTHSYERIHDPATSWAPSWQLGHRTYRRFVQSSQFVRFYDQHLRLLLFLQCTRSSSHFLSGPDTAEGRLIYHIRMSDIFLLLGIIVMLCWPWVILGVLFARIDGIPLSDRFADYVKNNPRNTNFFITLIGAIVNLIVASLFSTSILRYSQGWMAPKENISFFHLSLILAFRSHSFPWRLSDRKYLLTRKRWIRAALVLACIYAFTLIAPGVTTILTPLPISHSVPLNGTELDFSPNTTTCLEWFNTQATSMTNTCQWKVSACAQNTCSTDHIHTTIRSTKI